MPAVDDDPAMPADDLGGLNRVSTAPAGALMSRRRSPSARSVASKVSSAEAPISDLYAIGGLARPGYGRLGRGAGPHAPRSPRCDSFQFAAPGIRVEEVELPAAVRSE
jgi:hypothetical protein